jgi:hypothetical protein
MTAASAATGDRLWRRWVAANALGEMFGLGLTLALIGVISLRLDELPGAGAVMLAFAAAVAAGAIEATIVGFSQWWAMHPWFPAIMRREWWLATLLGALIAYVLGYLPSTLMSLSASATETPVAEPPQVVVLLLAAGLGAVGGAVLSFAQWWVLRRSVVRAWRWLPANMLAWAAGMPVIFWGIDVAFKMGQPWQAVLVMAAALLAAGAVVGAIHGVMLVRLAKEQTVR